MSAPSITMSSDAAGHIVSETVSFADQSSVQIDNVFGADGVTSNITVLTASGVTTALQVTGTDQPDVQVAEAGHSIRL